jgi:hypothetical protein
MRVSWGRITHRLSAVRTEAGTESRREALVIDFPYPLALFWRRFEEDSQIKERPLEAGLKTINEQKNSIARTIIQNDASQS